MSVRPERVIADLRELAALTGGPTAPGASAGRRVAGGTQLAAWQASGAALRCGDRRGRQPVGHDSRRAARRGRGRVAYRLRATWRLARRRARRDLGAGDAAHIKDTPPPATLRLVDWADEEGARFGRSLFGSSAAAGTLDPDAVRGLRDRDGVALPDALAACGVTLDRALEAGSRLQGIKAYLELHIEQGPVLETLGIPIGPVLGTFGVERHAVHFTGRTSHAGSTRMHLRHDALLTAARFALEARESAKRRGGVATCGIVTVEPGIVTAIPGACTITLDQRALDAEALASMLSDAREASERVAAEEGVTVVVGTPLADRADPVRLHAHRLRRGVLPRGRRHGARAAERRAARRGGDGAAHPHSDAVCDQHQRYQP